MRGFKLYPNIPSETLGMLDLKHMSDGFVSPIYIYTVVGNSSLLFLVQFLLSSKCRPLHLLIQSLFLPLRRLITVRNVKSDTGLLPVVLSRALLLLVIVASESIPTSELHVMPALGFFLILRISLHPRRITTTPAIIKVITQFIIIPYHLISSYSPRPCIVPSSQRSSSCCPYDFIFLPNDLKEPINLFRV